MSIFASIFLIVGAALLIFGFRKNDRTLLTAAAFVWLIAGGWDDFSRGFSDGLNAKTAAIAAVPEDAAMAAVR